MLKLVKKKPSSLLSTVLSCLILWVLLMLATIGIVKLLRL